MSFCGTCGARVTHDSKFCSTCGTAVTPPDEDSAPVGAAPPLRTASDTPPEPPPEPTPLWATPVGYPAQVDPPHTQTPRDRRGRGKWLVIGIATALLLIAAGASIWFRAQDLPNAGTVDGAQQIQELPSEAAVVGHWVGSCDA